MDNNANLANNNFDDIVTEYGDQASFALMLIAKIASKTERKPRAVEAFKRALKLNPFLWSCFENLCNMGEKVNPSSVFQLTGLENLLMCHGSNITNIESVVLATTPATQEGTVFIATPQQILNEQITSNNSSVCTPDESPLAQPLCMSGLGLLPSAKFKSFKFNSSDINTVSNFLSLKSEFIIL